MIQLFQTCKAYNEDVIYNALTCVEKCEALSIVTRRGKISFLAIFLRNRFFF